MILKNKVERIIQHFEKIKNEDPPAIPRCGKALCGTCGGYVGAIRESLDENMRNEIIEVLDAAEDLDMASVQMIYEWNYAFPYLCNHNKFLPVRDKLKVIEDRMAPILEEKWRVEREKQRVRDDRHRRISSKIGKSIDLKDIRKINHFLLSKIGLYDKCYVESDESIEFKKVYESILNTGMDLVMKTHDYSLIEALLVVLGDSAREHSEFFELAIKSYPNSVFKHCFANYQKIDRNKIENCFEALPENEKLMMFTGNPSIESQLKIVRKNGDLIRCIVNPSLEVQLEAVRQNINSIRYIENPDQKVALEAANKNAILVKYVKNPSLKLQLRAVKLNGFLIRHIKNPSLEVQLEAVKKYGSSIKHIENPTLEVQLEAVRQNGNSIVYIENPNKEVQLEAVKDI